MVRKAHFGGKYNLSKSKMFWLWQAGPDEWYSPAQIHFMTGVPLETCRHQCKRLHSARPPYIKRRLVGHKWHTYWYEYQLGARGKRWWVNALAAGMPLDSYLQEIRDYQQLRDGVLMSAEVVNDENQHKEERAVE